ncbi:MAG: hypothetical protein ACLFUU_13255 [Desulfobacteraceae bacterium]
MKSVFREKMMALVPVMVIVFAFTCLGLSQVVYGQQTGLEKAVEVGKILTGEKTQEVVIPEKDQLHMKKALRALNTAKAELKEATAYKGSHRVRAMDLIDQAVEEANLAIEETETKK